MNYLKPIWYSPMMGMGTSVSTAVSETTAVVIEDYMFESTTAFELTPIATGGVSDFHDTWDLDGTDYTPEVSPDDEGYWDDFENVVLNGDYEELGSELVTNGDFSSGSTGWENAFGGQWVISSGKATLAVGVDGSYLRTVSNILTSGKSYKAVITTSGGLDSNNKVTIHASSDTGQSIESDGTHTKYFTADGTSFRFLGTATDRPISIDSVSVQQVDPNDRWSLGTGWSIEDGKAVFSGTDFANLQLSSAILNIGDTYELTLTAAVTNGSFKVQHSFSSDLITESSSGTYSVIFTATATAFTIARASVGSQNDFTIDNVTVTEYAIRPLDV